MTYYFIYKDLVEKNAGGWIYLVKAEGTNRYKIGRSKEPLRRYQTLKRQSPYPLKVMEVFYTLDAATDEAHLHSVFAEHRIHGEWFEFEKASDIEEFFKERNIERSKTNVAILARFLEKRLSRRFKITLTRDQTDYLIKITRLDLARDPLRWINAAESFEAFWVFGTDTNSDPLSFLLGFLAGLSAGREDRYD